MNPLPRVSFPLAVAAVIVFNGCSGDSPTSPPDAGAPLVEAVSPKTISGIVGTAANPNPTVRIVDGKTHRPLANVAVEFLPIAGSGSVNGPTVTTDANGFASPGEWDFSTRAGINYLGVYLKGVLKLSFTATITADAPVTLIAMYTPVAGLPGSSVRGPEVEVRDRFANLVPKVTVSFAITAGDGVLQNTSAVTDNYGHASAGSWIVGSTPGSNQATASVPGIAPLAYDVAVLDPATIRWYSLESIGGASHLFTPAQWGIAYARIGLTKFDPCLCKRQEGYFIDELQYTNSDGQIWTNSGRYTLDGTVLGLSNFQQPGFIEAKNLTLQRPDDDFGFLIPWNYTEIDQ